MNWIRKLLRAIFGDFKTGDTESTPEVETQSETEQPAEPEPKESAEPEPGFHSPHVRDFCDHEMCNIVESPCGDGQCFEVRYPEDGFIGLSARWSLEDVLGEEPDVAHARYELFVPEDFETHLGWNHGGTKGPGFADHREGGGAGGHHNQGEAWSARMFLPNPESPKFDVECDVPMGFQVYDGRVDEDEQPYGWHEHLDIGGDRGEWITVDIRHELNSPEEEDGRIAAWINGEKAYDESKFLFLNSDLLEDRGIHEFRLHFYFGGGWGSPSEPNPLYIRNVSLWGDNVPEM